MANKSINLRPEDQKIVTALTKKKGGTFTSIVREAIRVLAQKEGVAA